MHSAYLNVTLDRRTDGRTAYDSITRTMLLHVAGENR